MVNSYSDIKEKVENLFKNSSANAFIAICDRALGGTRGLNIGFLTRTVALGSTERIHDLLEPYVNILMDENRQKAEKSKGQYNISPLGANEFRLKKIRNKDEYERSPEDYIVDLDENSCTCPEFVNRLKKIFIPCKHQYIVVEEEVVASVCRRLVRLADSLDQKGLIKEANTIDETLFKEHFERILGLGKYKPETKYYTCSRCGSNKVFTRELHPDTGMDEIAKWCPNCGELPKNTVTASVDFKANDLIWHPKFGKGKVAWDSRDGSCEVVFLNKPEMLEADQVQGRVVYFEGEQKQIGGVKPGFYRVLNKPMPFRVNVPIHPVVEVERGEKEQEYKKRRIGRGKLKLMDQRGKEYIVENYPLGDEFIGTTRVLIEYLRPYREY